MQNWFISWRLLSGEGEYGYQIFDSKHHDPAVVLAEQVKDIASRKACNPWDVAVTAFNKV